MHTASSLVENSAQVLSCQMKFVPKEASLSVATPPKDPSQPSDNDAPSLTRCQHLSRI